MFSEPLHQSIKHIGLELDESLVGTHGGQGHMGNWVVEDKKNPAAEGNADGRNVTELRSRFTVANYLTPHSDLVALMVLAHQVEGHNRLARAMVQTRQALHYEACLNRDLKEPPGKKWESTTRRIEAMPSPESP